MLLKQVYAFLGALSLLTRIPIPNNVGKHLPEMGKWIPYFPWVGLLMGLVYSVFGVMLIAVFPINIAAFLLVLLDAYLSGGLHLDGLCDTFDGLYSGKSGDELLKVMRDSSIGTYGGIALWAILLGKLLLIQYLLSEGMLVWLLVYPWVGRVLMYQVIRTYQYPQGTQGIGKLFKDFQLGKKDWIREFVIVLISFVLLLLLVKDLLSLVVGLVVAGVLINLFLRKLQVKLGGVTGDGYGASCELAQVIFTLSLVCWWGL